MTNRSKTKQQRPHRAYDRLFTLLPQVRLRRSSIEEPFYTMSYTDGTREYTWLFCPHMPTSCTVDHTGLSSQ